jgi:hypothetical protein
MRLQITLVTPVDNILINFIMRLFTNATQLLSTPNKSIENNKLFSVTFAA